MNQIKQGNQVSMMHSKQQLRHSRPSIDLNTMVYGKVPPQARELEEAVLGAIMLDKSAFDTVSEILNENCFYVEAHQALFRAFKNLSNNSIPIDLLTVVQALQSTSELDLVGGPYALTKLTNNVVGSAHIEAHSRIVLQKFIQRELIRISGEIIADAYDDSSDVFDLFDKAESSMFEISASHFKSDYTALGAGMAQLIQKIDYLKHLDETVTGVSSGFLEMDLITHGWQPSDLIILAARPSVGKTAFALNLACNAATNLNKQTAVGFFSLEMSTQQLLQRVVSMDTGIWMEKLANGRVDDTSVLFKAGNRIDKMKIFVDDAAGLNMFELRSKARRMVNKNKVGLIIIDYLQLMSADDKRNGNREQEISSISRGLKKLAKELNVPIIALSQLSREVEKRGKGQKVPQLSDLRESGAIEQDADMVMFLYRPPEDEVSEDAGLANKAMAKIAKHRNGKLESFAFTVDNNIQKWEEIGTLNNKQLKPVAQQPVPKSEPYFIPQYPANNKMQEDDDMPF